MACSRFRISSWLLFSLPSTSFTAISSSAMRICSCSILAAAASTFPALPLLMYSLMGPHSLARLSAISLNSLRSLSAAISACTACLRCASRPPITSLRSFCSGRALASRPCSSSCSDLCSASASSIWAWSLSLSRLRVCARCASSRAENMFDFLLSMSRPSASFSLATSSFSRLSLSCSLSSASRSTVTSCTVRAAWEPCISRSRRATSSVCCAACLEMLSTGSATSSNRLDMRVSSCLAASCWLMASLHSSVISCSSAARTPTRDSSSGTSFLAFS
mmetsp:Transcript_10117/g.29060  ORF Transcript_10117/g.29060 Transcript_10117/m.29060 type:complete len:277 (+) Transcript_10117:1222-2052(+)